MIRKIDNNELDECLNILHKSYEARDKELNIDNSVKTHTYMTLDELTKMYANNIEMYAYYIDNKPIGFISIDIKDNYLKIKDIVVLPEYQKGGIGTTLLNYVKEYATKINIYTIKLGLLYNNTKLVKWYEKNGFKLIETVKYDNSVVGHMELNI